MTLFLVLYATGAVATAFFVFHLWTEDHRSVNPTTGPWWFDIIIATGAVILWLPFLLLLGGGIALDEFQNRRVSRVH